jgi:hypothetical protein
MLSSRLAEAGVGVYGYSLRWPPPPRRKLSSGSERDNYRPILMKVSKQMEKHMLTSTNAKAAGL